MAAAEPEQITILLAEPDQVRRQGMHGALSQDARFAVTECEPGDLLRVARELQPGVVLVDPSADGRIDVELLAALHRAAPASRVVVLTRLRDRESFQAALGAGIHGYLLKEPGPGVDRLRRAVESVALDGAGWFDPQVGDYLTELGRATPPARQAGDRLQSLTDREREILVLLGRDVTDQLIAGRCQIGEKTVRTHVGTLRARLHISTRSGLGSFAREQGLGEPE